MSHDMKVADTLNRAADGDYGEVMGELNESHLEIFMNAIHAFLDFEIRQIDRTGADLELLVSQKIGDWMYRAEFRYGKIECSRYPVVARTVRGVWIGLPEGDVGKWKWMRVPLANSSWAKATEEAARVSLYERLKWRASRAMSEAIVALDDLAQYVSHPEAVAVKHADAQQIENSSRAIRGAILQEQWGLEDAGVPRVVV